MANKSAVTAEVVCKHCNEAPKEVVVTVTKDAIYHALECECKTTPYLRSYFLVENTWNSKTFSQTPKEAFDDAIKQRPPGIIIYRPSHAK